LKTNRKIDILFCDAGIHFVGNIEETDLETFERVFTVNFKGVFYALKCVLPAMVRQNGGAIVITGSDQSLIARKHSAVYGATKGAVAQLTKSTVP